VDVEGGESGEDTIRWEGGCRGRERPRRRGVGDAQCGGGGGGGDGGGGREGGGGGDGREECEGKETEREEGNERIHGF